MKDEDMPVFGGIAEDATVLWASFHERYHGKFVSDWENLTIRERNAWRMALAEIRKLPVGKVADLEEGAP